MVNSAYAATNLSTAVSVSAGIQSWTVPLSGLYQIDAYGAAGGDNLTSTLTLGGLGARIQGNFNLIAGDVLNILVGQKGQTGCGTGAGGGGTYVLRNGSLILAAGGGGGSTMYFNGMHGSTSTSGTMDSFFGISGGANGSGGSACTNIGSSANGGGGGGYVIGASGNGQTGSFGGPYLYGGSGGLSYLNGGIGGLANIMQDFAGGFGGGGGAVHCSNGAGGGGGYSGGAGGQSGFQCQWVQSTGGGGGGSYNLGLNQNNQAGVQQGNGVVLITYLCTSLSISVSGGNPLCIGNSATLSVNAASGYTWSNGSNSSSIVVSPSVNSNYSVIAQTSLNCLGMSAVNVSMSPVPSLLLMSSASSVCVGNNITLSAFGSGGTAPYTYTWNSSVQASTLNVSLAQGQYTYYLNMGDAGNCIISSSVVLNFLPNPVINLSSQSICAGSSATLIPTGAATYTWFPGSQSGSSLIASPAAQQIYTVFGTAVNSCTAQITSTISILPLPQLTVTSQSISCASLGNATVNASGGSGNYSFNWLPGAQNNSIVTGLAPNVYTVFVNDLGSSCTNSTLAIFSSVIPLSGNLSTSSTLNCFGASNGSASIVGMSGGSPLQNYLWSNGISTFTNPVVNSLSAGQWTVVVTDALTACSFFSVFTITQPSSLSLNIVSPTSSVCAGSIFSLNAQCSGGNPYPSGPLYSYTWSNSSSGSVLNTVQNVPGVWIYSVQAVDANGCQQNASYSINIVPVPQLSLTNSTVCPMQTASLSANGASTYTWLPSLSTGNTFTLVTQSSLVFTVIGSAQSCSASGIASVSILPAPVPSLSTNTPICSAYNISLTASGALTYIWSGPQGFGSVQQNPVINAININQSGIYTCTLIAMNTCTSSASLTLNVIPSPVVSAFASTVCSGQSLSLSASSSPGNTYYWTGVGTFSSTLQNPQIPNATSLNTGAYIVTVSNPQNCNSSIVVQASVTNMPQLQITGNNLLCIGDVLSLSASGGSNYIWMGPNSLNITSSSFSIASVNLNQSGNYTLSSQYGPCSNSSQIQVTVYPLPVPIIIYNNPLCENSTLQLQSFGASSYTWSGPSGFFSYGSTAQINNVSINNSGIYSLTVSDLHTCKSDTSFVVQVLQKPLPIIHNATVCLGGNVSFSASGGVTFLWTGPLGFSSTSPTVYLYQVSQAQTGAYTLVLSGVNGCTADAIMQLTGYNLGTESPSIAANSPVCLNQLISLSSNSYLSSTWSGPEGFSASSNYVAFVASSTLLTGTYTLSVLNNSYCLNSATVFVKVNELPQANLISSRSKNCVPYCTRLELTPTGSSSQILSTIIQLEGDMSNTTNLDHCMTNPGSFVATASYTDINGCTNNNSTILIALEKPHADFEFHPRLPIAGIDQVTFVSTTKGNLLEHLNWYFPNGSERSVEKTEFLFDEAGEFPVILTASNSWNCSDTVLRVVKVEEEFSLFIPNTFTPNGDGLNDTFTPIGQGVHDYSVLIYNKWGELLFSSNDISKGWDGNYKSDTCPQDTYNWKIMCKKNGKSLEKAGQVLLLR